MSERNSTLKAWGDSTLNLTTSSPTSSSFLHPYLEVPVNTFIAVGDNTILGRFSSSYRRSLTKGI